MNPLILTTLLIAQINIDAPEQVQVGDNLITCHANTESSVGWIVLQPVDKPAYINGNDLVMAAGCQKQTVIVLAIVVDWEQQKWSTQRVVVKVVEGNPDPGPDPDPNPDPEPDPDPEPPPGKRQFVVIYESEDDTPEFNMSIVVARVFCNDNGHPGLLKLDDDPENFKDGIPEWFQECLDLVKKEGINLPAIVAIADWNNEKYMQARPFPTDPTEVKKVMKEMGG